MALPSGFSSTTGAGWGGAGGRYDLKSSIRKAGREDGRVRGARENAFRGGAGDMAGVGNPALTEPSGQAARPRGVNHSRLGKHRKRHTVSGGQRLVHSRPLVEGAGEVNTETG